MKFLQIHVHVFSFWEPKLDFSCLGVSIFYSLLEKCDCSCIGISGIRYLLIISDIKMLTYLCVLCYLFVCLCICT